MPDIKEAKILIMATDGFEQSELLVPQQKLTEAGATVEIAAPKSRMKSGQDLRLGQERLGPDRKVDRISRTSIRPAYDALVLPGGKSIRTSCARKRRLSKSFAPSIPPARPSPRSATHRGCSGSGPHQGQKCTSYHSIKTDVINAGGEWRDEAVVTDKATDHQPQSRRSRCLRRQDHRGSAARARMRDRRDAAQCRRLNHATKSGRCDDRPFTSCLWLQL